MMSGLLSGPIGNEAQYHQNNISWAFADEQTGYRVSRDPRTILVGPNIFLRSPFVEKFFFRSCQTYSCFLFHEICFGAEIYMVVN